MFLTSIELDAQKLFSKTAQISFFSSTPIEDIEAISNTANTVWDVESGKMQWAVLIKSFEFEKALMQEHFNENYMESSSFPKATFKGALVNPSQLNLDKNGNYEVDLKGKLTIHGETQDIQCKALFVVEGKRVNASSSLVVLVEDFGIEIPSIVKENIAKEITINVKVDYAILD